MNGDEIELSPEPVDVPTNRRSFEPALAAILKTDVRLPARYGGGGGRLFNSRVAPTAWLVARLSTWLGTRGDLADLMPLRDGARTLHLFARHAGSPIGAIQLSVSGENATVVAVAQTADNAARLIEELMSQLLAEPDDLPPHDFSLPGVPPFSWSDIGQRDDTWDQ